MSRKKNPTGGLVIKPEESANYDYARMLMISTATLAKPKGGDEFDIVEGTYRNEQPIISDLPLAYLIATGLTILIGSFASRTDKLANDVMLADLKRFVNALHTENDENGPFIAMPTLLGAPDTEVEGE